MLSQNPAKLVQLPKLVKTEMRCLSAEDVARFLGALKSARSAALFAFAIATGMRLEEYFALQWKDLDLTAGTATVQRALVWRQKGGGWYFTEPKTSRSRRTIPLPASTVKALGAQRIRQAEERLKAGSAYDNHDLVFATVMGGPRAIQNLTRRHFKPALERAKLPESIRLYDLRHTCATLLLLPGENPKVLSERLGHASIVLSLDTYSHVLPSMQQSAAEKLEKMLFGSAGVQGVYQGKMGA